MTERVLGPTGSGRRRRTLLLPILAALVIGLAIGVPAAVGSHYQQSLEGSGFQIDTNANLIVDSDPDATKDWANVSEIRKADLPSGAGDDSFGQGAKEDTEVPAVVTGSIPPNKSDLLTFGVYLETTGTGARFLNLFWHRVQDPSGTTNMDFEFNQSTTISGNGVTPVRVAGDLLVQYDLSQGGTNPVLFLSRWVTSGAASQCEASNSVPCWSTKVDLSAAGDATGSINTSAIPSGEADGLGAISARTFGEAQLDFDALTGGVTTCTSFGSVYLKSRSSDSFTSALKDFIAPTATNLSNCGQVIIRKVTDPASDPATVQFGYTKSFTTAPSSLNTFPLGHGQNKTFSNVLFGSGYTVNETSLPTGWDFVSVDCTASTGVTPTFSTSTVTFAIDSASDILDCTYTNRARGDIKLVKNAVGGDGTFGFTHSITGLSASLTTASGTANDTSDAIAPGSGYAISENTPPTGWDFTSASCVLAGGGSTGTVSGSAITAITVEAGKTTTCTFTNTKRGDIKLVKNTVGGNGTFGFTHSISGLSASLTTTSGTANDTSDPIAPGLSYAISENTPPTGWDFTSASCVLAGGGSTGTVSGSAITAITVEAGKTTTCTFTNTKRAQVNITKLDDQSPPAALNGAVFTLFTDVSGAPGVAVLPSIANPNSCTTSGTGLDAGKCSISNIVPGTYWVVETTTPSGYATAPPQQVTLAAGATVSLTFTDPRLHKVIVIVCHEATNTLAQSSVTLGSETKSSLSAAPTGLTQAQLCGLGGASFGGLGHGNQTATVNVGSGAH